MAAVDCPHETVVDTGCSEIGEYSVRHVRCAER